MKFRGIFVEIYLITMAGEVVSRYVKLTKDQNSLMEEIRPGELNQPVRVPQIGDAYLLFDMMAITLEKLPAAATVARATIESLLIVAHIISSTSVNSHPQLVFPEALLLQLIKTMMHPDIEIRVGAHQIFLVILVRSATYPRRGYEHRKWQSNSTSAFASATALFEKLRREKECFNTDKLENYSNDDSSIKDMIEEEVKNGRSRKTSSYFHKLSYVIDRTVVSTCPAKAVSTYWSIRYLLRLIQIRAYLDVLLP